MRELELPDVQDVMLEYRKIKLLYRSALKEIGTKLEILNDEFKLVHQYNPIEHIESRLKTDESITRKLIRKGKEITVENIQKYIDDIAGVRVICSFTPDIYRIVDMIPFLSNVQTVLLLITFIIFIKHLENGIKKANPYTATILRA